MSIEAYKMQRDIQEAIQKQVLETKEEVVKAAVAQFERELRNIVGRTAINIANYFSVERLGTNLVITVKMERGNNAPNTSTGNSTERG